jgi:cellobiose phosphorylase
LGHLKRAIEFSLERSGAHGLPCGLHADWNDCIRLGHRGESVFVAFQLRYALAVYLEICLLLGKAAEGEWAQAQLARLDDTLERHAWDGQWYLRAYRADGHKFGSSENPEGKIFLSPQSWAVYSGHARGERAEQVMESVRQRLATQWGLMLCDPPFVQTDFRVMLATLFNPGMKENGSVFSHTQGWAIIAETMLGHGDRAYEYFRAYLPAAYNTKAEVREIEPYVYCQYTHSKYSPRAGASRIPWLSGSAAWSYFAATHYILGLRPEYEGLRIDPCIPSAWKGFKISRVFRRKRLNVEVRNPGGVQKGVSKLVLNGELLEGNVIPAEKLLPENEVVVEMG